MSSVMSSAGAITRHRLFWPVVALAVLLLACVLKSNTFLDITVRDGHLFGGPIDIVRRSSVLLLVALGMTLVIATRGIDLSVGAVMAIAGAVALSQIAASRRTRSRSPSCCPRSAAPCWSAS